MSTELRQLSEREREILQLVAAGLSNQQIANNLGVSVNTIKVHLRNVFSKIGATSRTEATMYAVRAGIVEVERDQMMPSTTTDVLMEEPIEQTDTFVHTVEPWEPSGVEPGAALLPEADARVIQQPASDEHAEPAVQVSVDPSIVLPAGRRSPQRSIILMVLGLAVVIPAIWGLSWAVREQTSPPAASVSPSSATAAPATSRWQQIGTLPSARAAFAVANVDDLIYVVGGENEAGVLNTVERFDARFGTWTELSKKPTPVTDIQAAVIGGRLYVPGGRRSANSADISDVFERYDPRTEQWEALPKLPRPRSGYALAAVEGKLYLIGGWDGTSFRSEVFEYDPDAQKWSEQAQKMPTARGFAAASVVGDSVYVLGGENASGPLTSNEVFTPSQDQTQQWARRAPLPQPRSRFGTAAATSRIHVLGGQPGDLSPAAYSVRTDSWEPFEASPTSIGSQPGVVFLDTSIVSMGGRTDQGGYASGMLSYQAVYTNYLPNTTNQ